MYRRRTDVFCRQRLQKRTQALQSLQGKTGRGRRWRSHLTHALGNEDKLFAVREGNHCSLSSHTRAPGLLPGMLPAAQGDGRSIKRRWEATGGTFRRIARTTEDLAWDGYGYLSHFFSDQQAANARKPPPDTPERAILGHGGV